MSFSKFCIRKGVFDQHFTWETSLQSMYLFFFKTLTGHARIIALHVVDVRVSNIYHQPHTLEFADFWLYCTQITQLKMAVCMQDIVKFCHNLQTGWERKSDESFKT